MSRAMVIGLLSAFVILGMPALASARTPTPPEVVEAVGAQQGICVVVGAGAEDLALALAQKTELLIYTQSSRGQDFEAACRKAEQAGYYGSRIFVGRDAQKLHLADNIADVVVDLGKSGFANKELLRVLRPAGKVLRVEPDAQRPFGPGPLSDRGQDARGTQGRDALATTVTKPFPQGVDDWTHPYHGPDNNPQSQDKVILAPYLTQFLAEPRYAPLPQVGVSSAGRMFKAFGHVAFKEREEPFLNKLVAFNGYNGSILWQRDLAEGVMIHRNTMIATPTKLYMGDDKSCKVIDTATGKLLDEIIPPVEAAGGTFWKWMALEEGGQKAEDRGQRTEEGTSPSSVLYAMMGEQEQRDPTKRWKRETHGWPWDPISEGWNQPQNPWGFGRHVLAIDPETKKVLWSHREQDPIDGRAICMANGRIYFHRFGTFLVCLDAKTGNEIWRKTPQNASRLFASIGDYQNRQDWRTNWRTTCYLKCSDKALYFAGPCVGKLLAVSAENGEILWEHPYSNFQLVLRDDGLFGLSGQIDKYPSMKFDPLTGKVLAEIAKPRRACTRPTGAADAIFFRAEDGSVRLDMESLRPEWISPMRPVCQEGVTIANGHLYWWPSVCDCQLTLYGTACLAPAGDFDFTPEVLPAERLVGPSSYPRGVAKFPVQSGDWPTFRADAACRAATPATVAEKSRLLWQFDPKMSTVPGLPTMSPPVAAGGLAFVGGADGIVRALDATTGEVRWTACTGGAIRMPPTIYEGRAFVGSGDGWVYAYEAATGRLQWRFRAAPAERMIPVYGTLMSTWPVTTGVLVDKGTAYFAAGIANYDGTYLYALDAASGAIKWHNSTSGHLDKDARTGVSVQGHLLLHEGKLYLAGGTSVSPAVYDAVTGKCLNDAAPLAECSSRAPRGWELSLLGGQVVACGKPFYGHPAYGVYDATVFNRAFLASAGDLSVVWSSDTNVHRVMGFKDFDQEAFARRMANPGNQFQVNWGKIAPGGKPAWSAEFGKAYAMAVCRNAVLLAAEKELVALSTADGTTLWKQPLPKPPAPWGLAVDASGRAVVTLTDGRVLCFGPSKRT